MSHVLTTFLGKIKSSLCSQCMLDTLIVRKTWLLDHPAQMITPILVHLTLFSATRILDMMPSSLTKQAWKDDSVAGRKQTTLYGDKAVTCMREYGLANPFTQYTAIPDRPLMGGLLLTLFHHPPSAARKILTTLLRSIEESIEYLLPSATAALFGDPVLAQVMLFIASCPVLQSRMDLPCSLS